MAIPALIAIMAASAGYNAYSSSASATQQKKIAGNEAATADRLAAENRAEAAKVESEATANAKALQDSTVQAQEDARKEEMRRRASAIKTLLSGSGGDFSTANTEKKILLGS